MSASKKCRRCGERAETIDNVRGTTFWGLIQRKTVTTIATYIRVACTQYRRAGGDRDGLLRSDEDIPLCDPCWGLLVGRFLQGRDVVARDHEHQWRPGRDGLDRCQLCYQTRISVPADTTGEQQ